MWLIPKPLKAKVRRRHVELNLTRIIPAASDMPISCEENPCSEGLDLEGAVAVVFQDLSTQPALWAPRQNTLASKTYCREARRRFHGSGSTPPGQPP